MSMNIPTEPMTVIDLADAAGCSKTTMQVRIKGLGLRPCGYAKGRGFGGEAHRPALYVPDRRLFQFTMKQLRAEGYVTTKEITEFVGTNAELCKIFLGSLGLKPRQESGSVLWKTGMTDAKMLAAWNRWKAKRQNHWTKQSNAKLPEDEQPDWLPTLPEGYARQLVEDERKWKARRGQRVTAEADGRRWTGELLDYSMVSVTMRVNGRVRMWLKKDGIKIKEADK